jgi:hypothetical protein
MLLKSDEWDDDGTRECAWFFNGGDIWQDGTCLRYGDVPSGRWLSWGLAINDIIADQKKQHRMSTRNPRTAVSARS